MELFCQTGTDYYITSKVMVLILICTNNLCPILFQLVFFSAVLMPDFYIEPASFKNNCNEQIVRVQEKNEQTDGCK